MDLIENIMFLNAIIFEKLKSVFNQLNKESGRYFLTFSPITTSFNNQDFNFLDNTDTNHQISDKYENQMAFAHLANAIVKNQKIYELNAESFLQENYKKIFDQAKLIEGSLSENDKQKYRNAKAVLYQEDGETKSIKFENYSKFKAKYESLTKDLLILNDNLMANPNDTESLSKKAELEFLQNKAFNDWIVDGDKDGIENAIKIVSNISERSVFVSQWNQEYLKLRADLSKVSTIGSNIEFLPVTCLPNDIYKYEYAGWKKVVLEENEISNLELSAKSSLSESLYNVYNSTNVAYSKIEFEYIFVTLLRNWFKPNLINSRFWNLTDPQVVSDENDINKGLLPAYIEKFVFVRRINAYNKSTSAQDSPIVTEEKIPQTYIFKNLVRNRKKMDVVQPQVLRISKVKLMSQNKLIAKPLIRKVELAETSRTGTQVKPNLHQTLIPTKILLQGGIINLGQQKTKFNLTLTFKDVVGNLLVDINILLKKNESGVIYSTETDNNGKVVFNDLDKGSYTISIQREELYNDFASDINVDADITKSFTIEKRSNPFFDMILMGAVNYRFPNLPNPLEDYTYS
ncbi:carboxypeptidase-like regulatory domain-containing protein [Sphingobacterium sp. SGL-16]|uniref:carboxypeptidase-like regulatory domain-containing protein n=1 Tax=Sphingobacterium sp. SGL-16 TaxID=2710883 RepID=UPI0013EE3980|nr:carboxypeptidase-like regulatory domain-containing protein [Sphingobacterium sp. SGL-16]NGM73940.1 carboxypeptidase regulatory-like domain-containing protein [Sphingobacterium sp. SGL-16]